MKIEISGKNATLANCRACGGCGEMVALAYLLKTISEDTIIAIGTGCSEVFSTPYPVTAWKVPLIHVAFENTAAVASGIEAALKNLGKKTKVIALAGDGGTFDIGFQALSGAIERGNNICYICLDNEAYMNTGVQRSGSTPYLASTTTSPAGKPQLKKPLPFIIAAHRNVYVATANIAYPDDLIKKIKKGIEFNGPSYIQILTPCVPGWKYPMEKTIEVARLAVETNYAPLYEIENGELKMSTIFGKTPVKEFLKLQGRYNHLTDKDVEKIQKHINDEVKYLQFKGKL